MVTQKYKQVPPGLACSAGRWCLRKMKKEVCGLVINVYTNLNFMTPHELLLKWQQNSTHVKIFHSSPLEQKFVPIKLT